MKKDKKDRSGEIGLGASGAGAVAGGTSVAVLTGGCFSNHLCPWHNRRYRWRWYGRRNWGFNRRAYSFRRRCLLHLKGDKKKEIEKIKDEIPHDEHHKKEL